MTEMKSFRDSLPQALREKLEARGIEPEEVCPRCNVYEHPGHECCYCLDGGRVSSGSGILELCPDCSGYSSSRPDDEPPQRTLPPAEWARVSYVPRMFAEVSLDSWTLERYREASGVGDPKPQIRNWLKAWPPARPFLTLIGDPGTGKTHLAIAAARAAHVGHGVASRMFRADDLLERYRRSFDKERATETQDMIDQELQRVPLLILDDLTTAASTDWATDKITNLVNRRYEGLIPTIVTSNAGALDARTYRRVIDDEVAFSVNLGARVS